MFTKTIQKIIFFEINVILKLVNSCEFSVFYFRIVSFTYHLFFKINQKRPLTKRSTMADATEYYNLVFIFIVIKTSHVFETWKLFRNRIISSKGAGGRYYFPFKMRRFHTTIRVRKSFKKDVYIDSFKIIFHKITHLFKSFTASCWTSKSVYVAVLNDTKSDSFSFH